MNPVTSRVMSRWVVLKPLATSRHGLLVLVAATALAVSQATAAGAPLHPAESTSAPVIVEQGSSESGYPIVGSGPSGVAIRFIDHGTFWIAVALRNRSTHAVTVARVDTVEPPGSLVQETGAVFARYHPCTGRQPCPFPDPSLPGSTAPLTLQPGQTGSGQAEVPPRHLHRGAPFDHRERDRSDRCLPHRQRRGTGRESAAG